MFRSEILVKEFIYTDRTVYTMRLIVYSIRVMVRVQNGQTALMLAAKEGGHSMNRDVINYLLDAGADITKVDKVRFPVVVYSRYILFPFMKYCILCACAVDGSLVTYPLPHRRTRKRSQVNTGDAPSQARD